MGTRHHTMMVTKSWGMTTGTFGGVIAAAIYALQSNDPNAWYAVAAALIGFISSSWAGVKAADSKRKYKAQKPVEYDLPQVNPVVMPPVQPHFNEPEGWPQKSMRERKLAKVVPETIRTIEEKPEIIDNNVPEFTSTAGWHWSNLKHTDDIGASLQYGTKYLYIRVPDLRSYGTGVLSHEDKILQVSQTHNATNPLRFVLLNKDHTPYKKGKYKMVISADAGTSYYNNAEYEFTIV